MGLKRNQISDEQVERVCAFIRDLLRQDEMLPNIVDIWDSVLPEEDAPSLVLPILCCEAVGGDENQATAVAAAWFLLYLAAKVLDDIEDGDALRAPWPAIGAPQAINAATSSIFAAQLALARLRRLGVDETLTLTICEDFNCTSLKICLGQHADLIETNPSLERYWQIVAAKSGEPFALACRAGALLGTNEVAPYSEFGYNLGVPIQICDDFEGVWNPRGRNDLAAGKRTLPIIYALTVAPPGVRDRLEQLLAKATSEPKAEKEAQRIITELGAPHYLLVEAQIRRQRAEAALRFAGMPSTAHRQLMALLNGRFRVPDDATEIPPITGAIQDKALALLDSLVPPSDRPRPVGSGF